VLQPCKECGSPYVILRYDGTVVCRSCKAGMKSTEKPAPKEPVKHDEPVGGLARLQMLVREAKERKQHGIIHSEN